MLLSPLTFVALICISNWRDLAPKPFRCFNEPRCIARSWSAFSVGRVVTDKSEQWRQVYLLRSSSEYEEPCWHVCHLRIGFFCSWSESRISISVISIHLGWEFFLCINIEVMYRFYVHKFKSCICLPRTLDILHAYAQTPPKKTNSSITFSAVCVCVVCVCSVQVSRTVQTHWRMDSCCLRFPSYFFLCSFMDQIFTPWAHSYLWILIFCEN